MPRSDRGRRLPSGGLTVKGSGGLSPTVAAGRKRSSGTNTVAALSNISISFQVDHGGNGLGQWSRRNETVCRNGCPPAHYRRVSASPFSKPSKYSHRFRLSGLLRYHDALPRCCGCCAEVLRWGQIFKNGLFRGQGFGGCCAICMTEKALHRFSQVA